MSIKNEICPTCGEETILYKSTGKPACYECIEEPELYESNESIQRAERFLNEADDLSEKVIWQKIIKLEKLEQYALKQLTIR